MTLQFRQPLPGANLEALVHTAFARSEPKCVYRDHVKRLMDIALVLCAAIPVLVVLMICAALVALDGGSPFYTQRRVGRFGTSFRMWKLRSMVPDADDALRKHLAADPEARAEWDRTQKLRNDPRITRIGQFLRKTSIDELPQLWNVLKGDMSLVGPRPMMVEQRAIYPGSAYYALRPGVTGLWQISVRNESSFAERAQYDAEYLGKVTLLADLSIMWKTLSVVAKGTGC
ncbi:sugar transferase [Marivita sp. GX14005]|uniref:sugar transferase n=1 Tax=Marivita sp. GX14005 TaxID=2942276 RepID=UPI002018C106|nr:sugar transferase [Marivita sp. GX14005]MCL3881445.1 sugar transferase [Marivita sp. GX14005]